MQNSGNEIMQSSSQTKLSIDNKTTNARTETSDEGKCNEHQKISISTEPAAKRNNHSKKMLKSLENK